MADADERSEQARPARPAAPAGGGRRRSGVLARREPSGIAAPRFTIPTCLVLAMLLTAAGLMAWAETGPAALRNAAGAAPTILLGAGLLAAGAAVVLVWQVARHYR